jgi:multidrug efflux system membrane fusion protein
VAFSVPEVHLPLILARQHSSPLEAQVEIPGTALPERFAPLTFVNNAVATNTGTIALQALDPNEDMELWPGQYVKVRLIIDQLQNGVLVPETAVARDPKGEFVYVVDNKKIAQKRPVKLLAQAPFAPSGLQGRWVVVLSGLDAGEQVVTSGQQRLRPGTQVRITSS